MLDQQPGASAVEVALSFLGAWRALLTYADFEIGCALVAVTVAAETAQVRQRAAEAFRAWQQKLASALEAGGLSTSDAGPTAALLLAASEGAVVICRAEHDIRHFDIVAGQLLDHVRSLSSSGGRGDG